MWQSQVNLNWKSFGGRSGQNNPELETEIRAAYSSGQLGEHLAQDRGWWAQRPDFGLL